jgi:hypothetical protein
MEFFLTDPDIKHRPPANTRLLDLRAEPYLDRKRLRVVLDLTPVQHKPYLELTLTDSTGEVVAATSITEPVDCSLELTLHTRKTSATIGGVYKLAVLLSFPDLGKIDRRELYVEIPSSTV